MKEKKNEIDTNENNGLLDTLAPTLILIAAVTAATSTIIAYTHYFPGEVIRKHSTWGEFGDFFGGTLNPIFGFLTIIALLVTIRIQIKELKLTRKAAIESADALKKQHQVALRQSLEQSFFRFLEDIKNDEFINHIRKSCSELNNILFEIIYKDGIEGADRKITIEELREPIRKIAATGYISQVLIEKTITLLEIAEKIGGEEKRLYIKILQTHYSPPLISFIYHFTTIARPSKIKILRDSKLIKGVSKHYIFTQEVANIIGGETEKNFKKERENLIEKYKQDLELINTRKSRR
ncbi:hypothetical protein [Pseudomonas sp. KB-10]|uniref:hypothetical protein n=1 Tax=Pseudomonas sp. KB-10 TaxID=2292264 RepID=UPI001BB0884B|nr:hypothetical protein [Pseudomonas sp. KB-10]